MCGWSRRSALGAPVPSPHGSSWHVRPGLRPALPGLRPRPTGQGRFLPPGALQARGGTPSFPRQNGDKKPTCPSHGSLQLQKLQSTPWDAGRRAPSRGPRAPAAPHRPPGPPLCTGRLGSAGPGVGREAARGRAALSAAPPRTPEGALGAPGARLPAAREPRLHAGEAAAARPRRRGRQSRQLAPRRRPTAGAPPAGGRGADGHRDARQPRRGGE